MTQNNPCSVLYNQPYHVYPSGRVFIATSVIKIHKPDEITIRFIGFLFMRWVWLHQRWEMCILSLKWRASQQVIPGALGHRRPQFSQKRSTCRIPLAIPHLPFCPRARVWSHSHAHAQRAWPKQSYEEMWVHQHLICHVSAVRKGFHWKYWFQSWSVEDRCP